MHPNNLPVFPIDPLHPQSEVIDKAVHILRAGGVVMFPAMGLYGLAADAGNARAVEKVYRLKQRPADKPVLVLIADIGELDNLVTHIPDAAWRLITKLWPGGVTLIFHAKKTVSERLTAGTGKIGVRMPVHPVAMALCRKMGRPITGTSANISGEKGWSDIGEMDISIAYKLDLILNAGPLSGGSVSTVVDVTVDPPAVLRVGRVSEIQILSAIVP
jgi:L-threonylcarbamoyladenylate synthase